MFVKKGETVKIITGSDKGKTGRVLRVYPKTNKILVEGIAIITKHMRPSDENPQGGRQQKESAIQISNVKLMFNGNPVKVGYKMLENGKKVRIAKKTQEIID